MNPYIYLRRDDDSHGDDGDKSNDEEEEEEGEEGAHLYGQVICQALDIVDF